MPSSHRRYAEWTPARLAREAEKIGPAKRRELMAVWAKYCCTPQTVTGQVVSPKKEAWA
jgi:hypothetical protein